MIGAQIANVKKACQSYLTITVNTGINALGTTARYGWGAENVLQMRVSHTAHIVKCQVKKHVKWLGRFWIKSCLILYSLQKNFEFKSGPFIADCIQALTQNATFQKTFLIVC